jgi:hypothetical protein
MLQQLARQGSLPYSEFEGRHQQGSDIWLFHSGGSRWGFPGWSSRIAILIGDG